MGAVRNQNLPPEEQNFDEMGIHPRKGSIKDQRYTLELAADLAADRHLILNVFNPTAVTTTRTAALSAPLALCGGDRVARRRTSHTSTYSKMRFAILFPLCIVTQFVCSPAPSALSPLFPVLLFPSFGMHLLPGETVLDAVCRVSLFNQPRFGGQQLAFQSKDTEL